MSHHPDIHRRFDGSIDIDRYRRAAAEERTKARLLAHARFDEAMAALVRRAKNLLSRRPGLGLHTPSPAGRVCYRAPLSRKAVAMIPRYSRPEMAAIWEPQTRFRIWFEIEAHATDALAELGVVPKSAAKTVWDKAKNATFDVARIDEIERETKHDVIAFLTHLAEIVGPEARFVHQG